MAYDQINPNGRDKIPRSARSTEPAWVTTVALPPETAPFDLQAAINSRRRRTDGHRTEQ